MKKIIKKIVFVVIIIILVLLIIINKNSKNIENESIKVAGITYSPLYLPLFVGIEEGMFNDLKVEFVSTTGGDIANTMLISGQVDVALNSLNTVVTNVDQENHPISIGELTQRGGITLISKVKSANIKTIVSAKKGGFPNMILEKKTDYEIVANLSPQEGVSYFLNKDVDAIMAFEPFATKLKQQGYYAESMNNLYYEIPFNCVLVMNNVSNQQKFKKLIKGLEEATQYIYETDSKKIASKVSSIMQYEDVEILSQIIDTFKKDQVWSKDLKLNKKHYQNYLDLTGYEEIEYDKIYKNILN